MITLNVTDAIAAVRKNLDEQGVNISAMFGESTDNVDLDNIIRKTLPEAINAVNLMAPVALLEGISDSVTVTSDPNDAKVLVISINKAVLRITSIKASDSSISVSEVVPENSAEGRKQLNSYIRGTYDNPRLVQMHGNALPMVLKYYSAEEDVADASTFFSHVEYLPWLSYNYASTATPESSYSISTDVRDAVIYQLTGMVLSLYDDKAAGYFYGLASKSLGLN